MADLWVRVKENPAATLQLLQVALGVLVAFEVLPFTDGQQAGVLAVAAAVLNLALALAVRSFAWPLITALVQAAIPLAVEFGWGASDLQIGAIYALVAAFGTWFVRSKVTPETRLPALRAVETEPGRFEVPNDERPRSGTVSRYPGDEDHRRRDPSAGGPGSW